MSCAFDGVAERPGAAPVTAPRSDAASAAVTCPVCPHNCCLAPGARGLCRARRNVGGVVVAENYGRVTSLALDPVEKKPLARFMPGSYVVSVGSYGCNLSCPFCQNHEISQAGPEDVAWRELSPEGLVELTADAATRDPRVAGVAFTYNEPLVGWEYVRDAAELAKSRGLVSVLVSNGCAELGVIAELAPLIDAANIDLKGFSPEFYRKCGGGRGHGDARGDGLSRGGGGYGRDDARGGDAALACVRATIERLAAEPGCHLEVTTLVVPGMNDSEAELDAIARWLASLDGGRGAREIVHHVTRFFPRWRMTDVGPTPVETVRRLAEVSHRHLDHVFVGNV